LIINRKTLIVNKLGALNAGAVPFFLIASLLLDNSFLTFFKIL